METANMHKINKSTQKREEQRNKKNFMKIFCMEDRSIKNYTQ